MKYDRSSTREKWTLMMYMRDFDLMVTYAYAIRSSNELTEHNINDILYVMEDEGIYRPRYGGSTFTGQFKSIQIAWYMFGYYDKSRRKGEPKKMVFSPLGNLLLDNRLDKQKASKIFLAMLFGNGFHQPFSQMDERFNIYPFRLIFQLLRDSRLDGRLYNDEVFYLAMFMKTIDPKTYEELVSDILDFRGENPNQKLNCFKHNENVVGLALHEWRYTTGILESAKIIKVKNDNDHRVIGKLEYGNINKKTGRHNAIRSYVEDYIELNPSLVALTDSLLESYPYYEKPYPEEELERKFNSAVVVDMYSFYPPELLNSLGMDSQEDQAIAEMLNVAANINYYAHEETDTGKKFEYALRDAFNLFSDVEAERIGNGGNADVECIYTVSPSTRKKFDIEAKARSSKLVEINSRRIKSHRDKIASEYTVIITPNFAIGVLTDIKGEESVVCKAAVLANYLYQYILREGRHISYNDLDRIIANNMGKDVTDKVNDYVYNNFGHIANDISIPSNNGPLVLH